MQGVTEGQDPQQLTPSSPSLTPGILFFDPFASPTFSFMAELRVEGLAAVASLGLGDSPFSTDSAVRESQTSTCTSEINFC